MPHALIVDDNMIISRAVQQRLAGLGFDSFDQTWTERQALVAAERRPPDLIVIGDTVAEGSAFAAASKIACATGAPVLMVSADQHQAGQRLRQAQSYTGPFLLSEIEVAVEVACTQHA